jgi:hypothetical protein
VGATFKINLPPIRALNIFNDGLVDGAWLFDMTSTHLALPEPEGPGSNLPEEVSKNYREDGETTISPH